MNIRKVLFRNVSLLVIDKVIRAVYTLFVGAMIARHFGPEKFGFISITVTLVTILASFTNFGADGIVVKELTIRPGLTSKIFGTIFLSRLAFCVIIYLFLILYYYFFANYPREEIYVALIISSTLLFNFSDSFDLWFQSQLINHKTIIIKMVGLIATMALRYFFITKNTSLLIFSLSYLFEALFSFFSMNFLFFRNRENRKIIYSTKILIIIFKQSWPNLVSGLMIVLYMRIDQVMINFLLDKRDLGLFSAAIPFSTAIYFVPMALSVVLTPILSKIRAQSIERYLNLFKSIYTGIWILLIPYCVIMSLVSPYLIKLFYGNKYDGAEDVLRILVYTAIPVSLGVVQGIWIVNEKLNNINLYKSIIGACSNVIFNFLLIPRFGIVGAAFSTLISYFLSAMVSNLFFCRDVFFAQLPKFNRGLIYELLKL